MTMVWLLRFCLYALVVVFEGQPATATVYLQTNEISNKFDESIFHLPTCIHDSVCGYLQVNARGVTQQRFCSCPSGLRCPMSWDTEDGHSITQGSDQYKFCDRAPTVAICEPNQLAYSSRMVYGTITEELFSKTERILCICPHGYNYVLAHQNFDEPSEDTQAVSFSYTCGKLPVCGIGDSCKMVSEKGPEFLVNRKCQCPGSLRCPTLGNHGVKSFEMGNGRVNMLRCQH